MNEPKEPNQPTASESGHSEARPGDEAALKSPGHEHVLAATEYGTLDALSEPSTASDRIDEWSRRLSQLQNDFADNPRAAMEQAHDLMAQIVEAQATHGDDVDAEKLHFALQRYRDFFNRVSSVRPA